MAAIRTGAAKRASGNGPSSHKALYASPLRGYHSIRAKMARNGELAESVEGARLLSE